MKRIILKSMLSFCILCLAGCSSIQVARNLNDQRFVTGKEPVAHLNVSNFGVYLLPWIPLASGSTRNPGLPAIFRDNARIDAVIDMMTARSKSLGGTELTDLQSTSSAIWIPLTVFWYKSVEASGNISK